MLFKIKSTCTDILNATISLFLYIYLFIYDSCNDAIDHSDYILQMLGQLVIN